ncbi:hypothetical protein CFAM422_001104 [Trichoderma lentiforme]|uniref:Uncharacterized protein n=1 Tax=Trichoderma lentiforme TaxID=1567552 RepID=A0A9P5CJ12_9HYPO|nr:hypothetical protein CFAM422_001104 [Trichoderma lentiforme]
MTGGGKFVAGLGQKQTPESVKYIQLAWLDHWHAGYLAFWRPISTGSAQTDQIKVEYLHSIQLDITHTSRLERAADGCSIPLPGQAADHSTPAAQPANGSATVHYNYGYQLLYGPSALNIDVYGSDRIIQFDPIVLAVD